MPKSRPPIEVWREMRRVTWERDNHQCTHCGCPVPLSECHCDHIVSGKYGTNDASNRRILCRRCHVLRADHRHQGMVARALEDGIVSSNWRELVWEVDEWTQLHLSQS